MQVITGPRHVAARAQWQPLLKQTLLSLTRLPVVPHGLDPLLEHESQEFGQREAPIDSQVSGLPQYVAR
jgi:hypothetical protein